MLNAEQIQENHLQLNFAQINFLRNTSPKLLEKILIGTEAKLEEISIQQKAHKLNEEELSNLHILTAEQIKALLIISDILPNLSQLTSNQIQSLRSDEVDVDVIPLQIFEKAADMLASDYIKEFDSSSVEKLSQFSEEQLYALSIIDAERLATLNIEHVKKEKNITSKGKMMRYHLR